MDRGKNRPSRREEHQFVAREVAANEAGEVERSPLSGAACSFLTQSPPFPSVEEAVRLQRNPGPRPPLIGRQRCRTCTRRVDAWPSSQSVPMKRLALLAAHGVALQPRRTVGELAVVPAPHPADLAQVGVAQPKSPPPPIAASAVWAVSTHLPVGG